MLTSEFDEVFGSGTQDAAKQGSSTGWTIVLAAFSGPDAGEQADAAASRIRAATWMADLRVKTRDEGAVLSYGQYPSPGDAGAKRDLERVRRTQMNGESRFLAAFLAPPDTPVGANPAIALQNVREEWGRGAMYTLQVGVYESPNRQEAMRSAEQAALQLRREGELAFYHHGPSRSMVTIGVFRSEDYNLNTGRMAPEIIELKRRHPYNLFNGRGITERGSLGERLQPSGLVLIPE
ncbi:MAG: hypothetical protein ACF8QF_12660 [Phycisphaerales bacterium]